MREMIHIVPIYQSQSDAILVFVVDRARQLEKHIHPTINIDVNSNSPIAPRVSPNLRS